MLTARAQKAIHSSPRRLLPMPRNALGRGLGALIRELQPKDSPEAAATQPHATSASGAAATPAREAAYPGPTQIDIDLIEPSPFQPRTRFREEGLDELARSSRASGIIRPLVVRPIGSRYQLIAGERRWRAAQRAGLGKVSVIVRQVSDEIALEMTLVENIQREDLNAIETARAFDRLMDEFRLTQEAVAERTGKDRATVANAVRLLKLEPTIQEWIEEGKLSAGHGRALLAVADPQLRMRYAHRASRGGLTVRQIERLAARRVRGASPVISMPKDANIRAALDGTLTVTGTFRIDGNVKGNIISEQTVILGEGAKVEGQIEGNRVVISGRFDGVIFAKGRVEIEAKGVVTGEVHSPCMVIDPGGIFDGRCHMLGSSETASTVTIPIRAAGNG